MGGDGDWFYPGMSPFQFLNQKPGRFYGSQTGAQGPFWREADYPFTRKHVYTPDAAFYGRNRAFPGGEANKQGNERSSSYTGSRRRPKVTTIPVQDGKAESMPQDLEGRVAGKGKGGSSEERNAIKFVENKRRIVPVTVSCNLAGRNGESGAMMMDNEAATLIQSHFRGYMVRRTAPLNCLRVIMSVLSQLRNLKAQIITDEYMDRLRADPKERVKLSETIMSLLLRLDALQGVHSAVREIRKAAVHEAVALQETVDLQLQNSLCETVQGSKALPTAECNYSVNGSYFTPPSDDQDMEKHLEAALATHLMSGSFSENVEEKIASAVPMKISNSLDEENETRHLGEDTDSYITSDEILSIDERDLDGNCEMTSHAHTTVDDTSMATEFPKLKLGDDVMEHEDAEISCKDIATTGTTGPEGEIYCSHKNMEQNEFSLDNCATKVASMFDEDLQRSRCQENLKSTIDGENSHFRNDAEEGEKNMDADNKCLAPQELVFQKRSSDAISDSSCMTTVANGSSAEADSDALHLLQIENEELKRMLKRCRMTNELQTSLVCDLRDRISLLERRLEEKSKTAVKSSSKCKKRSSRGGRISERRSNQNRNRYRQSHDHWLRDENCDVAAMNDDSQVNSE